MSAPLIFVDTNVFLDYYSIEVGTPPLAILPLLADRLDRLVTTETGEMEFKKNRQHVILENLQKMNEQPEDRDRVPAFLVGTDLEHDVDGARKRLEDAMLDPDEHDPVWRALRPVFDRGGAHHLSPEDRDLTRRLHRRARRRFEMGRPPRKSGDTAFADAFHWEYLVHLAHEVGEDLLVISRDNDFGLEFNGRVVLNDWLRTEWDRRVGDTPRLRLAKRLDRGLRDAGIDVPEEIERKNERVLEAASG